MSLIQLQIIIHFYKSEIDYYTLRFYGLSEILAFSLLESNQWTCCLISFFFILSTFFHLIGIDS